jgi:hypothetical protein
LVIQPGGDTSILGESGDDTGFQLEQHEIFHTSNN